MAYLRQEFVDFIYLMLSQLLKSLHASTMVLVSEKEVSESPPFHLTWRGSIYPTRSLIG
jgi:hypothetical protein